MPNGTIIMEVMHYPKSYWGYTMTPKLILYIRVSSPKEEEEEEDALNPDDHQQPEVRI